MEYTNRILQGDALAVLQELPDDTFHTCVTSPPYWGQRDYGVEGQIGLESTPDAYIARMVEVFREVRRTLRPDGTLWLNIGDSYAAHRGLQPPPTNTRNKHGHAQQSRVPAGLKMKDLIGIPWMLAFALRADGWYLRSDIIWHKPNAMPESVRDRPTKAHEYIFLLSKSQKYHYDWEAVQEPLAGSSIKRLSQPTFDTQTGGEKDYRNGTNKNRSMRKALENLKKKSSRNLERKYGEQRGRPGSHLGGSIPWEGVMRNRRSVWNVSTKPIKSAHFAVFPPDLIEPCILAGCPEGGTVLDPFIGSGTTALVAQKHGRNFTGIDLNGQYIDEIAGPRIYGKV